MVWTQFIPMVIRRYGQTVQALKASIPNERLLKRILAISFENAAWEAQFLPMVQKSMGETQTLASSSETPLQNLFKGCIYSEVEHTIEQLPLSEDLRSTVWDFPLYRILIEAPWSENPNTHAPPTFIETLQSVFSEWMKLLPLPAEQLDPVEEVETTPILAEEPTLAK